MWCWRGWGLKQVHAAVCWVCKGELGLKHEDPVEQISLFWRAPGCFWLICEIVRNSEMIWWKLDVGSPEMLWSLYISQKVVEKSFLGWSESRRYFVLCFVIYLFRDRSVFIIFVCLKRPSLKPGLEVVNWPRLHTHMQNTVLQSYTVLDSGSDHLPSFRLCATERR